MPNLPLVTLGVPVFNGGDLIEPALRALLAQDYPKLEILVSDNASTDRSAEVCKRAAESDPRVRYVRQPANIGAARNFEFLAREARGELFAWCAHDDLRLPGFVVACAAELARRPEAVLCNSAVAYLDERGRTRRKWWDLNFETRGLSRARRAARLLDHTHWVEIYGLTRREALLRALPFEPVFGSDVVLSMKLLMLGDFAKVNRTLFLYRLRGAPKPIGQIMEDVTGTARGVAQPYTEMLRALVLVSLDAAKDRGEREEVVAQVARTVALNDPISPLASWRAILRSEHPGVIDDEGWDAPSLPGHLVRWIAEHSRYGDETAAWERIAAEMETELRRARLARLARRARVTLSHRFPKLHAAWRRAHGGANQRAGGLL